MPEHLSDKQSNKLIFILGKLSVKSDLTNQMQSIHTSDPKAVDSDTINNRRQDVFYDRFNWRMSSVYAILLTRAQGIDDWNEFIETTKVNTLLV